MVQALAANDVPFGPRSEISRDELLSSYLPEKTLARNTPAPSAQEQEIRRPWRGETPRKRGESFTVNLNTASVLPAMDMGNVRANFGIGLCYIERV